MISVRGSVRVGLVYWPMGARGSVRVWMRVLNNGSSWFGACLDACTDQWELVVRWVFGCVYWPMGARGSVRVLTNGSSWFGAYLGACTDQWELVVRCVFGCVYWPMEARGSVRVWVRVWVRVSREEVEREEWGSREREVEREEWGSREGSREGRVRKWIGGRERK